MPLTNVTHKPTEAQVRQFDGSLESFLDILNARDKAGLSFSGTFDDAGNFAGLSLSSHALGANVQLTVGDWVILPNDAGPASTLDDTRARARWQA